MYGDDGDLKTSNIYDSNPPPSRATAITQVVSEPTGTNGSSGTNRRFQAKPLNTPEAVRTAYPENGISKRSVSGGNRVQTLGKISRAAGLATMIGAVLVQGFALTNSDDALGRRLERILDLTEKKNQLNKKIIETISQGEN